MARTWKLLLWSLPALSAICLIAYVNRPDGFSIEAAPLPVAYSPARDFGKVPWIDVDLPWVGNFRFPNYNEIVRYSKPDPDVAGVLVIGPGRNEEKWRRYGIEYPADGFGTEDYSGGEWANFTYVPYASSEEDRHVEMWVKDRWVKVTLPYKSGSGATLLKQLSQRAGPFRVMLSPKARLSNLTSPTYALTVAPEGTANLIILSGDFKSSNKFETYLAERFLNPKEDPVQEVRVNRGVTLTLNGIVAETEAVDIVVEVSPRGPTAVVKTSEGVELYNPDKGVIPAFSGFDAIKIIDVGHYHADMWIHKQIGKRNFLRALSGPTYMRAIGYRFKRSGSFQFVISNTTR